jgi:hypothetical protein
MQRLQAILVGDLDAGHGAVVCLADQLVCNIM